MNGLPLHSGEPASTVLKIVSNAGLKTLQTPAFLTGLLLIADAGVAGGTNTLPVKIVGTILRGPFGNLPQEQDAVEWQNCKTRGFN